MLLLNHRPQSLKVVSGTDQHLDDRVRQTNRIGNLIIPGYRGRSWIRSSTRGIILTAPTQVMFSRAGWSGRSAGVACP